MLSSACEYGLRAAIYLASLEADGYVPIRRLSDDLGLSFPFLTKVFQQLTQAGLLASLRGPNGGVAFTRNPATITLREVIEAIDGPGLFTECVLGLPGCGEAKPCPLHAQWAARRAGLQEMFESSTLGDVGENLVRFDVRLAAPPKA